jgi:hypothetical protein
MSEGTKIKTRKIRRDIRTLRMLTRIYCRDHHQEAMDGLSRDLCRDCSQFVDYAAERLCRCPLTPKPTCRDCHIHCFASAHRDTARRIMRYSWPQIVRRGRIDLLWKLLLAGPKSRKNGDRT